MKDWLENYRPVRQRTVRSETTKDKAGSPPPAVYSNANPNATARVFFPADQVERTPTASSEMRSLVSDVSVSSPTANPRDNCRFQPGGGVRERFG